jgi:epsilon-lactone hydrolase
MLSFKSRMFNFFIRNSYLFQGRVKKEAFSADTSIVEFRERCEKGAARYSKLAIDISVKEQFIEGIKSEWLIPKGADPSKVVLYIHGGGYVSGSCSDHRGLISKFASYTRVSFLFFEYRLAPENPLPSALDDSVKMYKWLLNSGYPPSCIIIAGESAGGGLCLATLLALKDKTILLPRAAVAISPWTDLTCSGESYKTKNKVSPAPLNSWSVFSKHYAGEYDASHPYISPLFGNLEGLPPLFINAGVDDELYDDGEQFFLKAKEAGVDATFRAGTGMVHCYPLLAPMFREATEAMKEIAGFIQQQLKSASHKL